jgi:hypothetical protein
VQFQGRYLFGAPVCGAITYGTPGAAGGFRTGYASIQSGVAGLGDSPSWADAFASYQPGQESVTQDIVSAFRDHPWIALLIAAGLGFGIAAVGKMR